MWKADKQPYITGFQFHNGSKWMPRIGHSFAESTENEYMLKDDGDYFNDVNVSFADDQKHAEGEYEVTEIKISSKSGYTAHQTGGIKMISNGLMADKTPIRLKQKQMREGGIEGQHIIGIRGRYHEGWKNRNFGAMNKMVQLEL